MRKMRRFSIIASSFVTILCVVLITGQAKTSRGQESDQAFPITIIDDRLELPTYTTFKTVADVLNNLKIVITELDVVIPPLDSVIGHNSRIIILRPQAITVSDGAEEPEEVKTKKETVGALLRELEIELGENDRIEPEEDALLEPGMHILVIRVTDEEVKEEKEIAFETEYFNDASLYKGTEKVAQEGKKGKKEITYNVVYENGKEVSREKTSEEVIAEPVNRVIRKGTKDPIGRTQSGKASWYGTPGLSAASRDFPRGTRLRVTNTSNGQQVTVTVVGYGPQSWTGKIIDLSPSAFSAIASLSQGVCYVRIEELLN